MGFQDRFTAVTRNFDQVLSGSHVLVSLLQAIQTYIVPQGHRLACLLTTPVFRPPMFSTHEQGLSDTGGHRITPSAAMGTQRKCVAVNHQE